MIVGRDDRYEEIVEWISAPGNSDLGALHRSVASLQSHNVNVVQCLIVD